MVERRWCIDLLEEPVLEHRYPVAHRHGLDLVVRHVDHRDPEAVLELDELGPGLHAQLRVEVRKRLVHEVDRGLPHDRATHRHPLPLSAGQRLRLAIEIGLKIEDACRFAHAGLALLLGHALLLQREADVLGNGELRVERVVLEDHRDVPVARADVAHVYVADVDRPAVERLEAGEHSQRG